MLAECSQSMLYPDDLLAFYTFPIFLLLGGISLFHR